MIRPKFGNFVDCDLEFVKDDKYVYPELSIATILNRTALTKTKGISVEHFPIFEKLVFVITSNIFRILMRHIEIKNGLASKPQTIFIYTVRILNMLEVIAKTNYFKNHKCSTLTVIKRDK